jgi:Glucose-6-phosphate dehydrogenase, NAD binding domain/Glucose-6-phosphate dehydrogenase, C-terminal domain
MHIKILVLGITGNLAELKVLPGIAQFAEVEKKNGITVELHGYSRSIPDDIKIQNALNKGSTLHEHSLTNITYHQGEYTDLHMYSDLVSSLTTDEQLYVYLAVPPSVYINFLEQSCTYAISPVTMFIEKPFGTTLAEMKQIQTIINQCNLHKRVLFVDHYRFKSPVFFKPKTIYPLNDIQKLEVIAYETLGVEDRLGYYGSIGAVKDMMVHLCSLTELQLSAVTNSSVQIENIKVSSAVLGHYESIHEQLPQTSPTYFKLNLQLTLKNNSVISTVFSSGKKLTKKQTATKITIQDNLLLWNITDSTYQEVNPLSETILIRIPNLLLDHTNLFSAAVIGDMSHFLLVNDAVRMVELEESVLDQITQLEGTSDYKFITYTQDSNPETIS